MKYKTTVLEPNECELSNKLIIALFGDRTKSLNTMSKLIKEKNDNNVKNCRVAFHNICNNINFYTVEKGKIYDVIDSAYNQIKDTLKASFKSGHGFATY